MAVNRREAFFPSLFSHALTAAFKFGQKFGLGGILQVLGSQV